MLFEKQRCKGHSSANFSNAMLKTRQQCCFFKGKAANTAAVLFFQSQHWKRASSVDFSKATLQAPQQCCFCKILVANPTATLLFQMQRCWMAVSKCAADTDLDRVQSSLRARSSVRIERWSPEPKVRGSNPLGRIGLSASRTVRQT